MYFNGKTYEILKWVAVVVLPASATALFAIGEIWGRPNTEAVVGTIVALNTLLGASLGVSTAQYNASPQKYDGTIDPFYANAHIPNSALNLSTSEIAMAGKNEILLKVVESGLEE